MYAWLRGDFLVAISSLFLFALAAGCARTTSRLRPTTAVGQPTSTTRVLHRTSASSGKCPFSPRPLPERLRAGAGAHGQRATGKLGAWTPLPMACFGFLASLAVTLGSLLVRPLGRRFQGERHQEIVRFNPPAAFFAAYARLFPTLLRLTGVAIAALIAVIMSSVA